MQGIYTWNFKSRIPYFNRESVDMRYLLRSVPRTMAASARKLPVQVRHTLGDKGSKDTRDGKSFDLRLTKLTVLLGKALRTAQDCIANLKKQLLVESEKL